MTNNMKYFVKYLPVEGELTDENRKFPNQVYPVKPFLCSRDIQVGDEMNHPFQPYTFRATNNNKEVWKDCFKVMGEISPDAIWVKEGDEFEEDDIQQVVEVYGWEGDELVQDRFQEFFNKSLSKTCSHFIMDCYIKDKEGEDTAIFKVFKNTYQIKCPTCKQFH
jgi:hypothetical protein